MRPLLWDDLALVVALRWYLERQTRNLGIPAKFVSGSLDEDDRFSSELETACFRIMQEGVTNIVRHARATRISVRLERVVSDLVLLIRDDGAGFDMRCIRASSGMSTLGLPGNGRKSTRSRWYDHPRLGSRSGHRDLCGFPIMCEKRRDADFTTPVELAEA
ncbi:MAG TPA: ATP-binding protein [Pyrinomonadaceae bacterium]|nr:ATP-binding protein [Pyrinomonadaceae bacterium]